jgi:hypothetical protein
LENIRFFDVAQSVVDDLGIGECLRAPLEHDSRILVAADLSGGKFGEVEALGRPDHRRAGIAADGLDHGGNAVVFPGEEDPVHASAVGDGQAEVPDVLNDAAHRVAPLAAHATGLVGAAHGRDERAAQRLGGHVVEQEVEDDFALVDDFRLRREVDEVAEGSDVLDVIDVGVPFGETVSPALFQPGQHAPPRIRLVLSSRAAVPGEDLVGEFLAGEVFSRGVEDLMILAPVAAAVLAGLIHPVAEVEYGGVDLGQVGGVDPVAVPVEDADQRSHAEVLELFQRALEIRPVDRPALAGIGQVVIHADFLAFSGVGQDGNPPMPEKIPRD